MKTNKIGIKMPKSHVWLCDSVTKGGAVHSQEWNVPDEEESEHWETKTFLKQPGQTPTNTLKRDTKNVSKIDNTS